MPSRPSSASFLVITLLPQTCLPPSRTHFTSIQRARRQAPFFLPVPACEELQSTQTLFQTLTQITLTPCYSLHTLMLPLHLAAANHEAPLPSPTATMGRISPLKWVHLRFFCGVAMDTEVPAI